MILYENYLIMVYMKLNESLKIGAKHQINKYPMWILDLN